MNIYTQRAIVEPARTVVHTSLELRRELGLFDGVALVVGSIIGSGIFLIPSFIAVQIHSLAAVLLVWIIGGILTLCGALSLAELGALYPGTGGLCTYLREAYGSLCAFLYAWALLFMIHSGSIAALGVAFGLFLGQILPLTALEQRLLGVSLILGLTAISCLGIRAGKLVQNLFAIAKISGLVGIIFIVTIKGSRSIHLFSPTGALNWPPVSVGALSVALVAVLWAYEGWHVISFVGGEMKNPRVNLPRSLLYGGAIVMLIFLAANVSYYHALSPTEIQASNAVAAFAVGKVLGPVGAKSISFLILVSLVGCANGFILAGPRVYYAMACDGIFPAIFGKVSDRYRTPMVALTVQGIWAAMLAVSGSYQQLFTDVVFTAWIFYGLAVAAVLVLRRKQPEIARPFSVPGYPFLSLLFCGAATTLVLYNVIQQPRSALIGISLVVTGLPIYLWRLRNRRAGTVSEGAVAEFTPNKQEG